MLGNNCLCVNNLKINFIGEQDESIQFLGLHLDEHLTWTKHISAITSKISKSLFAINRVKYALPHYALKNIILFTSTEPFTIWNTSLG